MVFSSLTPNVIRVNPQGPPPLYELTFRLEAYASGLLAQMGADAYYALPAIFTEKPFIRPMGRNTQLPNTIRYIDMNPQRLATKRHISRADCVALNQMAEEICSM